MSSSLTFGSKEQQAIAYQSKDLCFCDYSFISHEQWEKQVTYA